MFKNAEEICKAVDNNETVYWGNTAYTVHKSIGGYNIYCSLNKSCIGLTHEDGKTLNGEIWEFFTEKDLHDNLPERQREMMKDEIRFLRAKLQEKEGIPSYKFWSDCPHYYLERKQRMEDEFDEADLYRLMAKLQKAKCYKIFQNLNKEIIHYLTLEWSVKPTDDEILKVICQFYGREDKNMDKLYNAVTQEEFETLASMTYGLLVK